MEPGTAKTRTGRNRASPSWRQWPPTKQRLHQRKTSVSNRLDNLWHDGAVDQNRPVGRIQLLFDKSHACL